MVAQIVLQIPLGELPGGVLPGFPPGAGHLPAPYPPGGEYPGHLPSPQPPGYPDIGLPPGPGEPEHLPSLPVLQPPLSDKVIVAIHRPGEDWVVKSFEPGQRPPGWPDQRPPRPPGRPDQGLPTPPYYPDQGLPGKPEYPSTGPLPPGRPPVAGQPLPRPPWEGQPDQGLPSQPPPGVSPHR